MPPVQHGSPRIPHVAASPPLLSCPPPLSALVVESIPPVPESVPPPSGAAVSLTQPKVKTEARTKRVRIFETLSFEKAIENERLRCGASRASCESVLPVTFCLDRLEPLTGFRRRAS